jgi:hypothetical protein
MRIAISAALAIAVVVPAAIAQDYSSAPAMPPYTAKQTITHIQILANGTNITQVTEGTVARDADGRTRQENSNTLPDGSKTTTVFVNDPVDKVNLRWTTGNPAAQRIVTIAHFGQPARTPANTVAMANTQHQKYYPNYTESLQPQTIEGLYVTGNRNTRTIPAGTEGNDHDIVITSENWFSQELRIMVRFTTDDPRSGKNTTELSEIVRTAPDPALFKAPAGYELRDATLQNGPANTPAVDRISQTSPVTTPAQPPVAGLYPPQTTSGTGFTGVPYSGKETTERVQTAADGSKFTDTHVSMIWRDTAGRTRQDHLQKSNYGTEYRSVVITDPIAGMYLKWTIGGDNPTKVATIWPLTMPQQRVTSPPPPRKPTAEAKPTAVPVSTASKPELAPADRAFGLETLTPQEINGVFAEGTRTKRIVHTGTAGKNYDISVINELWVSPDLRIIMRHVMDDPRTGLSTTNVTDVVRGDPDPSMFKAPDGYEVRDMR